MAALTANKYVEEIAVAGSAISPQDHPVKAAEHLYTGAIACLDASARLVKGTTAVGLVAAGVVVEEVDGGAADGDKHGKVKAGVFGPYDNSAAGDAIAADDVGKECFIVDDQTVALTDGTGTRSSAGKVYAVVGGKVYVSVGLSRIFG